MQEPSAESLQAGKLRPGRILVGMALAALLCGVFFLYSNPQLVIMLTDQLWACF